jgi:hypothetical protein
MPADESLQTRLSRYVHLLEQRRSEPDPFHILNITRTESPYTHFLGWVIDPAAAHPWKAEFLIGLLRACNKPLPPDISAPMSFYIESYAYSKDPEDDFGFTHPDIVAVSPDGNSPQWCLVIENKFDSKEGRASANATQCAKYEERSRKRFGDIQYALLFTTRTGERPQGETCFTPVSYDDIARIFGEVRQDLYAAGRWQSEGNTTADRFACYLLDSFLRHLDFILPKEDVRNAVRALSRKETPAGISSEWLQSHKGAVERASELVALIEQWDFDSMKNAMVAAGATALETQAFDAIYAWGQRRGSCEFGKPKTPSVVIKIPTSGQESQILCIQGRKLRFYWVHLVGSKESGNVAGSHAGSKFPGAYELVEWFCLRLNETFGWELAVKSEKGGFLEPSRPLEDIAEPQRLEAFLEILTQVADRALASQRASS